MSYVMAYLFLLAFRTTTLAYTLNILIAHNNKGIAGQIKEELLRHGMGNTIEVLENGIEAEQYIFTEKPQIAILDIRLEDADSMNIAKRLQDAAVSTRIIVLTEKLDDNILLTGLANGILGYLTDENIEEHLVQCAHRVQNNLVYVAEEISS